MKRKTRNYSVQDTGEFLKKLIQWLPSTGNFSLMNGNDQQYPYAPFDTFAAAGSTSIIKEFRNDPFEALKEFYQRHSDWMTGYFSYELKNYIEKLTSRNPDRINFPEIYFFIPETLIFIRQNLIEIRTTGEPHKVYEAIMDHEAENLDNLTGPLYCDTREEVYLSNVEKIRAEILEGEFYELNYCLEYYGRPSRIHLPSLYRRLNSISPMPMSVFQGMGGHYIFSASPERFLKKSGNLLIAQPIKGTVRRDPDPRVDEMLKYRLRNSEKEIAENMMIVDLMRNDLGKSALPGTVKVPEIFGIYSFSHLHQMISTVTCRLRSNLHPVDVIRNAFPMGSMTGAPKIRAMQAIEGYESSRRGPFSGAAGYFTPEGNFDFNVLIRSIFYNQNSGALKFNVGSAITFDADAAEEYAECQLKAMAIREVLSFR